jgi:hypothetical protein
MSLKEWPARWAGELHCCGRREHGRNTGELKFIDAVHKGNFTALSTSVWECRTFRRSNYRSCSDMIAGAVARMGVVATESAV